MLDPEKSRHQSHVSHTRDRSVKLSRTALVNARPNNWLPGLDLLRASAVFLVVIGHGKSLLDEHSRLVFNWLLPMPAAWGVEFFFALSGFLIGRQWLILISRDAGSTAITHGEVKLFFAKRWLRTMPTYWLCLLLFLCLGLAEVRHPVAIWITGNIFLIASLINSPAAIPVSWTLAIEEFSYAWVGISAWIIRQPLLDKLRSTKTAIAFPAAAITIGLTARIHAASDGQWELIHHGTIQRIDALAYGILAAWAIRSGLIKPDLWPRKSRILIWSLCTATVLFIQSWIEIHTTRFIPITHGDAKIFAIFMIPSMGIVASVITTLLATRRTTKPIISQPKPIESAIREMARISYTVYLTHIPVRAFIASFGATSSIQTFCAYVISVLALGLTVYPVIEHPFMELRRKYVASQTRAQAPTGHDSTSSPH